MRILLIRHGQTPDNVSGSIGTVLPGPGLTELGFRQASAIPEALAAERIEAIYVSTLRRTRLTAGPLANSRGLEIREVDGLQEITGGDLEGLQDADSVTAYMGTIFSWWSDFSGRIPGGESGTEFFTRFTEAINSIAGSHDGTVAVFSHGAAIRTWASYSAANLDAAFSRTHGLENTAVVVIEGSPADGWNATHWAGEPVGGSALEDATALDPTGEAR